MSIFSRLFGRKNNLTISSDIVKKDARSRNIAFVDTEVGLKDHKILFQIYHIMRERQFLPALDQESQHGH